MTFRLSRWNRNPPLTDTLRLMRWLARFGRDFWHFLRHYPAWWITPIVVILGLLALLAWTDAGSEIVPMIYKD